jgi:hypothetical protein
MGGSRKSLIVACSIAMVMTIAPSGISSAAAKKVVSARTSSQFAMLTPGIRTVQSVKLTTGSWTVTAKATAVNFQAPDFVRCQLYDATRHIVIDGSTVQIGSGVGYGMTITNLAIVSVSEPAKITVQVQCGHDTAAGNSAYLDADASLVAFQSIGGQATNQLEARTTTQTPIPASGATVASLTLDAGTWTVGYKVSAVSFSGGAIANCNIETASDQEPFSGTSVGGSDTGAVVTFASFNYRESGGTIDLVCFVGNTPGVYLDPNSVLWARKANAYTAVEGGCGARLKNATTDLVALTRDPSSECAISGDHHTRLSSATVGKGTWVALGGEIYMRSITPPSDFLRCELSTQPDSQGVSHLDGSAVWEGFGLYEGISVLGAFTASSRTAIDESCWRDSAGTQTPTSSGALILIRP